MPPGSAQQNFKGGPQDETGDFFPVDEKSANSAANDNFQPNPEEPANDNDIPETGSTEEEDTSAEQQAQLTAQQQANIAAYIAGNKQEQLLRIRKEKSALENQLGELEKNLTKFKSSKLSGVFSIFQPKIKLLIDTILEEMKKGARNLSDKQKIGYYTGLIVTVSSLIAILTALKMVAAVIDATFSWLTKAIPSAVTCIGCILFIIIAPLYIPFLALIFMLGAIPLMKGKLTKIDAEIIKDLKKQKAAWEAELKIIKKKVALRKQIKALYTAEKQVKRQK